MNEQRRRLVLNETAKWRQAGIIDDAAVARIHNFYPDDVGTRRSLGFIISASLGALLVGLGIIALFAANWSDLSRTMRAVASILPVLTGAALCLGFQMRNRSSQAYMEPTGLFWGISIGAGIALISQTYHLPGDLGDFLLVWMLLLLPVVYATHSFCALLGYEVGVFVWTCYNQTTAGVGIWYWPLIAAAIPMIVLFTQANPLGARALLSQFGFILFSVAALGVTLEKNVPGLWTIIYSSTFALCTLFGRRYEDETQGVFKTPMRSVGAFGQAVLLFILMYEWPWEDIGRYRTDARFHAWASYFDYALAVALPTVAIILTYRLARWERRKERRTEKTAPAWVAWTLGAPLVVIVAYAIGSSGHDVAASVSATLIAFTLALLGIGTLVDGLAGSCMARVNGGTLCILAVVLGKFFSDEFSFTVKGIVFITCGLAFLSINLVLSRWIRRKEVAR